MASQITNPPQAVSASAHQATKIKRYVNLQLEKTRKQVKSVDLIAGGLVLIAFVIGFLMLAALVDGWICPLSHAARWACLVFLVTGCVSYTLISIVPLLLKRINPDYAAKMIEEAKPSFQNSLLNYVSLRKRPDAIKPAVFDAVSRQAAANLATVPEDATVDRSKLIRLGFVLVGLTLFAVGYKILSPKDPLQTVARIVYPGGKITKPAVVNIVDVKPGDARVFFGEQLNVTAVIRGRHNPEDVRLMYSTLDGQHVEQTILMTPDSVANRYRAALSMAGGGIQQSLRYQIVARDGVSPEYEVTVQPNPAITIESLVLQPPAYTKMRARTLAGQGDIDAIEGTKVTIHAVANLPIKLAYIELLNEVRNPNQPIDQVDYDSRYRSATTPIQMQSEGTSATGNFQITLDTLREKPIASHYRIRFVSTDDNRNSQPNVYPIQIIPDLAPEIRFRNPDTRIIEIPVNSSFPILLEANDLDFEIKYVELNVVHKSSNRLQQRLELSSQDGNRRVTASYRLCPADLGLKEGDIAIFFGKAADNRMSSYSDQPDPNISSTEKYTLKVSAPDKSAQKDPDNQSEKNQPKEKGDVEEDQVGENDNNDSGDAGSDNDDSTEDPDQQTSGEQNGDKPGEQKGDKPGNEEEPETGENGNNDSADPSEEGDPESGGSQSEKPDQQPEQQPEGGGSGSESSDAAEGSESQNDSANDNGGSGSESEDNSQTGEGGGSSSTDPFEGDPQRNADPEGGGNSNEGEGRQDDSLTSGAQDSVSDNASESELIRKMQEHFGDEQNGSTDKNEGNDPNDNPDSKDHSDPDNNSSEGAQGTTTDDGDPGSEASDPDQTTDPPGQENAGSSSTTQDNPKDGQTDTTNQGQDQTDSNSQNPDKSGSADTKPDSNDPNQDEPGKVESGEEESGKDESAKDESGKTESGKEEPGGESEKGESGKGESGKTEPGEGESGTSQVGKSESSEGASSEAESGESEAGDSASGSGESGKGEFGKGETGKGGTGKGESGAGETAEGDPGGANSKEGGGSSTNSDQTGDQPSVDQQSPQSGSEKPGGNKPGSSPSGSNPGAGSGDQINSPTAKDSKAPGGTGKGVSSAEGEQLKREKRNRDHAEKATDMILNRLSEQKHDPDPELLRKLKMSKEDLEKFIKRWDEMKRKAETGDVSDQAKYDRALKSLGLKPKTGPNAVNQNQDKVEGLNEDGAVNEPPPELVPDFNSFIRDLSRVRDN